MTPRERVLAAINHRQPDRAPMDLGGNVSTFTEGAYRRMLAHLGIDDAQVSATDFFTVMDIDERVLERLRIDLRRVWLNPPSSYEFKIGPDGTWRDEWGIRRTRSRGYSEILENPLRGASAADLKDFDFPDPDDPARTRGLRERIEYLYHNTDYAISAAYPFGGILELCCWLRGMDAFLMDLATKSDFALALLERVSDLFMRLYDRYLDIAGPYLQIAEIADDYGMQTGPIISPRMYLGSLAPYHRKLTGLIRSKTQAKIFHHSCGSVFALMGDLHESGVDILNPIQPLAKDMEPEKIKQAFGDRLVFHGGIDVQKLLPFGTPDQVREETLRRVRILGAGGGYILAPAHNIQDDVPPENVVAMYDAAAGYYFND